VFREGGEARQVRAMEFAVADSIPADATLVLPFWTSVDAGFESVTFVREDGTRLAAPWRLGGYVAIGGLPCCRRRCADRGRGGALSVGAPMLATEQPGWSRLF
jgi:hypothetical protein